MSAEPDNHESNPSYLDKGIDILHQFIGTLLMHKKAVEFIREQKPWRGIQQLGWVLWAMIIAGAILSYQFYQEIVAKIQQFHSEQLTFSASLASVFSIEKLAWVVHGSRKYLIMIVMELVVFYIIQRTLEIRTGRKPTLTTKAFIDAEFRILSSTILAWVFETFTRFMVVNLALGILGIEWLKQPAGFLIQCYFLGFAMVDNYHECFELKVSQSERRTRKVAIGVALGTGVVTQILMYVPILGAFAASVICAVAATLAMERFAPISEAEHLLLLAEQQKRKEKKPRAKHASE
ncbi:MAG: hypothetical protein GC192_03415 [Bacteroidetes bacterium]|nr:hypothetical protein [Bacteroidota bacterium]